MSLSYASVLWQTTLFTLCLITYLCFDTMCSRPSFAHEKGRNNPKVLQVAGTSPPTNPGL